MITDCEFSGCAKYKSQGASHRVTRAKALGLRSAGIVSLARGSPLNEPLWSKKRLRRVTAEAGIRVNRIRSQLEAGEIPETLKTAWKRAQSLNPGCQELQPPVVHSHPEIIFRGKSDMEYTLWDADADSWTGAFLRFGTREQRDRVLRIMGQPGRPAWSEGLNAEDSLVFRAIERVPTPFRAVKAKKNGVFFLWDDLYRCFPVLDQFLEAVFLPLFWNQLPIGLRHELVKLLEQHYNA